MGIIKVVDFTIQFVDVCGAVATRQISAMMLHDAAQFVFQQLWPLAGLYIHIHDTGTRHFVELFAEAPLAGNREPLQLQGQHMRGLKKHRLCIDWCHLIASAAETLETIEALKTEKLGQPFIHAAPRFDEGNLQDNERFGRTLKQNLLASGTVATGL
jgi:hypothetical protein